MNWFTTDSLRLVGTLVLVALVIVFTLQNTDTIGVNIFFWDLEASGAIFVFLNFAIGLAVGWFLRGRRGQPVLTAGDLQREQAP